MAYNGGLPRGCFREAAYFHPWAKVEESKTSLMLAAGLKLTAKSYGRRFVSAVDWDAGLTSALACEILQGRQDKFGPVGGKGEPAVQCAGGGRLPVHDFIFQLSKREGQLNKRRGQSRGQAVNGETEA